MPNPLRRCVYTLHFVAASIVGGLFLLALSAAALAVARNDLARGAAPSILPLRRVAVSGEVQA